MGVAGAFLLATVVRADELIVIRRSWHVDVGFAAADIAPPLQSARLRFPGARYIYFGFGDRRYLLANHEGSSTLSGALWPGAALILVTTTMNTPEQAFGQDRVIHLEISPEERLKLEQAIAAAFDNDERGAKYLEPGPYEGSVYIEALPRYSGFHTCNTWAAEVMQTGGLSISSRGVLFAGQLWSQVKRLRAHRPAGAH